MGLFSQQYLRLFFRLFFVVVLAGCDGRITVEGTVTDAVTHKPVQGAEVYLKDTMMNDDMHKYVNSPSPGTKISILLDAKTDALGKYRAEETIAGPGSHEVWLLVRKDGYQEKLVQVWSGSGLPDLKPRKWPVVLHPSAVKTPGAQVQANEHAKGPITKGQP